jgi:hypothetical protein
VARLPRIVVAGCPHHVTAGGSRREPIFFENGDQNIYCDMLAERILSKRWSAFSAVPSLAVRPVANPNSRPTTSPDSFARHRQRCRCHRIL